LHHVDIFRKTAGNERAFTMIYVETNSIIGSENLAFEEYFLKKEDIRARTHAVEEPSHHCGRRFSEYP